MSDLDPHLEQVARAPVLLVASDFDGTIAPIEMDYQRAAARREALVALRALSKLPQTHVAIISGRALQDLSNRTAEAEDLHLVGSHGSEFEIGLTVPLTADSRHLLERVKAALLPFVEANRGFRIEEKPSSIAFHYRMAEDGAAFDALETILAGPASWPGVHVRHGKRVLELSVLETNKGAALQRLRQRLGATAVVFLGDDLTDEDAFAHLTGPDVGIKVGVGESRAAHRIEDSVAAAALLARLAERRADWLAGADATPIDHHSLLSDQRTLALVTPGGRVTWLCLPRVDSGAVFAELLGGPAAGYFEICPVSGGSGARQQYVGNTMVLRTEWPGLTLTDYLDCGDGRTQQRAGRSDLVRVIEGRGQVRVTFSPRLDFGRIETRLHATDQGIVVEGLVDSMVLYAPGFRWEIRTEGRHQTAVATREIADQPVELVLRCGTASLQPSGMPEAARRRSTEQFWSNWAATLTLPSNARDAVLRSALVLKALCYGPTGAIVAAATTSLPEHAGGVRNWDYRFCWPRDAAMAATALARLNASGPAIRFLDWMLSIFERCEPSALISPVYSVTGSQLGPEAEIGELSGYRGSRPVRIGNGAARQVQLDVFGPIAALVALLAERGSVLSSEHWRMIESIVAAIESRWSEPDHGIWEVRRGRQHYVHSKTMCWYAVDRALAVAEYFGHKRPKWNALRSTIEADVLANGWQPTRNAFCSTYHGEEPDAAALAVGLCGLVAPDDGRWHGTIEHVDRHLRQGPTVVRYRYDDGLPGIEGGFHLCTSWLIESYARCGLRKSAEELFGQFLALAGPTGLLSEEHDPRTRQALGNYPQAYSHLGLINAALALSA